MPPRMLMSRVPALKGASGGVDITASIEPPLIRRSNSMRETVGSREQQPQPHHRKKKLHFTWAGFEEEDDNAASRRGDQQQQQHAGEDEDDFPDDERDAKPKQHEPHQEPPDVLCLDLSGDPRQRIITLSHINCCESHSVGDDLTASYASHQGLAGLAIVEAEGTDREEEQEMDEDSSVIRKEFSFCTDCTRPKVDLYPLDTTNAAVEAAANPPPLMGSKKQPLGKNRSRPVVQMPPGLLRNRSRAGVGRATAGKSLESSGISTLSGDDEQQLQQLLLQHTPNRHDVYPSPGILSADETSISLNGAASSLTQNSSISLNGASSLTTAESRELHGILRTDYSHWKPTTVITPTVNVTPPNVTPPRNPRDRKQQQQQQHSRQQRRGSGVDTPPNVVRSVRFCQDLQFIEIPNREELNAYRYCGSCHGVDENEYLEERKRRRMRRRDHGCSLLAEIEDTFLDLTYMMQCQGSAPPSAKKTEETTKPLSGGATSKGSSRHKKRSSMKKESNTYDF